MGVVIVVVVVVVVVVLVDTVICMTLYPPICTVTLYPSGLERFGQPTSLESQLCKQSSYHERITIQLARPVAR